MSAFTVHALDGASLASHPFATQAEAQHFADGHPGRACVVSDHAIVGWARGVERGDQHLAQLMLRKCGVVGAASPAPTPKRPTAVLLPTRRVKRQPPPSAPKRAMAPAPTPTPAAPAEEEAPMPTTKSESKPDTCAVHNCHEPVARVVKHGAKPTPADVRDLCRAHRTERLSVRWRKGKASPSAATPKPTAGKQPKPAAKGKPKQPKPAKQWADVADPFATVFAELKTAFEARALVDMIGWDVVRGLAARVSGGGR